MVRTQSNHHIIKPAITGAMKIALAVMLCLVWQAQGQYLSSNRSSLSGAPYSYSSSDSSSSYSYSPYYSSSSYSYSPYYSSSSYSYSPYYSSSSYSYSPYYSSSSYSPYYSSSSYSYSPYYSSSSYSYSPYYSSSSYSYSPYYSSSSYSYSPYYSSSSYSYSPHYSSSSYSSHYSSSSYSPYYSSSSYSPYYSSSSYTSYHDSYSSSHASDDYYSSHGSYSSSNSPSQACYSDGDIKLVGGITETEGTVEICKNGVWGTVCDDFWDEQDARVVCKQLGFPYESAQAVQNARFGAGSEGIHMDDVRCSGHEGNLSDCPHRDEHNCRRGEDAGVRCTCDVDLRPSNAGDRTPGSDCKAGDLRLSEEPDIKLELCLLGTYRPLEICDDSWDDREARVYCNDMGYRDGSAIVYEYGGEGHFKFREINCHGDEDYLDRCSASEAHCVDHYFVGVECFSLDNDTASRYTTPNNYEYTNAAAPSNVTPKCEQYGDVRLVGGSSNSSGRVEICDGRRWATVCDDHWDNMDARVVCRQLGFHGGHAHQGGVFGSGSGDIIMDDVQCGGYESALTRCDANWHHNCNHSEDAGVSCWD